MINKLWTVSALLALIGSQLAAGAGNEAGVEKHERARIGIPGYKVVDSNERALGPVISIDSGIPVVLFRTLTGESFEARVNPDRIFFDNSNRVYFSDAGCQGTVFLLAPESLRGLAGLRGRAYSQVQFGNPSAGDIWIYRSDEAFGTLTPVESKYATECSETSGVELLVTGTAIMNLSVVHPSPYSMK